MAFREGPFAQPAQILNDHLGMRRERGCRKVGQRPFYVAVEETTHEVVLYRGECRERSLRSELDAERWSSRELGQIGDTTVPDPRYYEAVPISAQSGPVDPLVGQVRCRGRL